MRIGTTRNYLLILLLPLLLLFCSTPTLLATDNGNGVDQTYINNVHSFGLQGVWYTNFDPSSTSYVYNQAGGTAATSGLLNIVHIITKKSIFISIDTLNSTSITVIAEGKRNGSDKWVEIVSVTYTAAETDLWPLLEYTGDVRIGVKVVGDVSGDSLTISGEFITLMK